MDAHALISDAMLERHPHERARFLSECIVHAAGLLAYLRGDEQAALALYRAGDSLVARTPQEND